jgi:hypothetical protein
MLLAPVLFIFLSHRQLKPRDDEQSVCLALKYPRSIIGIIIPSLKSGESLGIKHSERVPIGPHENIGNCWRAALNPGTGAANGRLCSFHPASKSTKEDPQARKSPGTTFNQERSDGSNASKESSHPNTCAISWASNAAGSLNA